MANRYWVGGSASWDATAGTKWATTSGGAGGAAVPTTADDVFFNGASGASTVTVAATVNCKNLDFSGFTGTFAGSSQLNCVGSIILGTGMSYTHTGTLAINPSGSQTIQPNGKTITSNVTINGTSLTLLGNLIVTGTFTLTAGILDANNKNVTLASFSSSNSNARTINLGDGTWFLTGTGTIWNMATSTNAVILPGASTIKSTNTANTAITFAGGGLKYNNLWFDRGTSNQSITISGSNTFNDFKDTGTIAHSILFTVGITTTVASWSVNGLAGQLITINSTTTGTHNLVKTGGGQVSANYLNIQHSVATPAVTWYTGTTSTNNQAVATAGSGWAFTAPPIPLTILSVSPVGCLINTTIAITIKGTGFLAGATVTIDGNACTSVVVVDSQTITAVCPVGLTQKIASLIVTNTNLETAVSSFTYMTSQGVSPAPSAVTAAFKVTPVGYIR